MKDGIYLIQEGNKELPRVNLNIFKIKEMKVTQRLAFNENIPLLRKKDYQKDSVDFLKDLMF